MTPDPASRTAFPGKIPRPDSSAPPTYRGRFAPSPTGPLHFGSLVTALASFLDARAHAGQWLLRIEDLDPPREPPGAADSILRSLDALGLYWDGAVLYQHTRHEAYQAALDQLRDAGLTYPCACSRREISDSSLRGIDGPIYQGTCRGGLPQGKAARAMRIRVPDDEIVEFDDQLQGRVRQHVAEDIGDFILRRADGYFAYQLAVVVDDAFQGITHVVRGADLLLSTPRQIFLQRQLGLRTPAYMHLPVAVNESGEKLSKQTGATPLMATRPIEQLFKALAFLHQQPPVELLRGSVIELLDWATAHWGIERVSQKLSLVAHAS